MARIRTIKPEFWSDEKVVQLPYEGRLLFIGMWNFADDEGRLWDEALRLRMQIFPGDDVDSESLLDLLIAAELVERRELPDGRRALLIPGFTEHQVVSHPAKSRVPLEGSRKIAIPLGVRRQVAQKYRCDPGESKEVTCYYCGTPGSIHWWRLSSGKPSGWVSFTLEMDHLEAESAGGEGSAANIVLACRACNRQKGTRTATEFREDSGRLPSPPEGSGLKGIEGKGIEGKGTTPSRHRSPNAPTTAVAPRSPPATNKGTPPSFDAFWDTYPRRNGKRLGKADAIQQWKRLTDNERTLATIGAGWYTDAFERGLTYVKDAHRWLAKREWTEWQTPAKADPPLGHTNNQADRNSDAMRARKAAAALIDARNTQMPTVNNGNIHTIDTQAKELGP